MLDASSLFCLKARGCSFNITSVFGKCVIIKKPIFFHRIVFIWEASEKNINIFWLKKSKI